MKHKLIHPLWTHLPALSALIILISYIFMKGPYEASIPIHYSMDGRVNGYAPPWVAFGLIIGLSILYILLSIFLDELWARQEKKKAFNWLSLMDDITVGTMTGVTVYHVSLLGSPEALFRFPWTQVAIFVGICTALAILLELLRPFRHHEPTLVAQDSAELIGEISEKIGTRSKFMYWEAQNPVYVPIVTLLVPLILFITGISIWTFAPWSTVLYFAIGILMMLLYGGLRTIVTPQDLSIRLGMTGIRIFHIRMDEIRASEIHEFSPLRDFGGYGIRVNREMRAYYLKGNRGVKLTRGDGKKFLIGSDNPERLAALIERIALQH